MTGIDTDSNWGWSQLKSNAELNNTKVRDRLEIRDEKGRKKG